MVIKRGETDEGTIIVPRWLVAVGIFCITLAGFGFRVGIEVFQIRNEIRSLRYDVCKIQTRLEITVGYACHDLDTIHAKAANFHLITPKR